jgi:hypothetical protein
MPLRALLVVGMLVAGCGTRTSVHGEGPGTTASDGVGTTSPSTESDSTTTTSIGSSSVAGTTGTTGTTRTTGVPTWPLPNDPYGPCPGGEDWECFPDEFGPSNCLVFEPGTVCEVVVPDCSIGCPLPVAEGWDEFDVGCADPGLCKLFCRPGGECPPAMICYGNICLWPW